MSATSSSSRPARKLRDAVVLRDLQRAGDLGQHALGLVDRPQRHEARAVREPARLAARQLERQAGLADPARAGERDHAHVRIGEQRRRGVEVGVAADQRVGRRRQRRHGNRSRPPSLGQQQVEPRILGQHRALELLELAAGLEPEVLHQRAPGVAERVERLGLAAGPIQREHELRVQPLAVRVLGDQRLQLAGHRDVLAQLELEGDALLEGRHLQLGEPGRFGRGEAAQRHVLERPAAEEGERLAPEPGGGLRIAVAAGRAGALAQRLEARQVELLGLDVDRVAGRARDDRLLGPERAAQLREMHLHGLGGGGRRIVAPQLVDEPGGGHRVVPVGQQQDGQQHALLRRLELDRALRPAHVQRSENRVVQRFTHA